jgi:hypothetical protein
MEELRTFYTKWLLAAAVSLAIGTHLMASYVIPDLERKYSTEHWTVVLATVVMSRPVLLGLIILAEWLIRTKIWRLKWVHPELDFAGTWNGVSTYTDVYVGTGTVPRSVTHEARIAQDCLSIRLVPASGAQFVRFESTAVNLIDAHRLVYSYYVKYHSAPGSPDETYGYEELNPVGEYDKQGRPKVLHGWFSHCVRKGQTPLYSGSVVFTRKK